MTARIIGRILIALITIMIAIGIMIAMIIDTTAAAIGIIIGDKLM